MSRLDEGGVVSSPGEWRQCWETIRMKLEKNEKSSVGEVIGGNSGEIRSKVQSCGNIYMYKYTHTHESHVYI